ncbi:NYN domain-containing protein [Methanolobus sp. ZRKC3]|uniref:LabA-like NYN domain-containing protein n=1 Tax=Methanolobus sp. ZRKC3 TaxID=3125786 RepID=UPI003256077A
MQPAQYNRTTVPSDQRIAVFADVQNMFYAARNIYDDWLDYYKLLNTAINGRKLIRAIAYVVETDGVDQSGFKHILETAGWEIRTKQLKIRPDGSTKGDWDMGIAIDAISIAHKVDTVVLVSGDGDFTALVDHLKASGVRVEVTSFERNTALELINSATSYYPLNESVLRRK